MIGGKSKHANPVSRASLPPAAQLVCNLGELVWLPSFVLADSTLTWMGVSETVVEVRTSAGDREIMVCFEINHQGDVIRASSLARPYDVPGGYAETPWYDEFGDHRQFDRVRIPAVAVATFEKGDGSWEYFRGRITTLAP